MRSFVAVLAGAGFLTVGILGCQQDATGPDVSPALSQGNDRGQGQTIVQICHFRGHTAPSPWSAAGTTLDGDYVVLAENAGSEAAHDYCLAHGGQETIWVAAPAARNGHDAQLVDRISGYE